MVGAEGEGAGFVSVWQPWSSSKAVKLQRSARTSLLCRAAGAEEGLDLGHRLSRHPVANPLRLSGRIVVPDLFVLEACVDGSLGSLIEARVSAGGHQLGLCAPSQGVDNEAHDYVPCSLFFLAALGYTGRIHRSRPFRWARWFHL